MNFLEQLIAEWYQYKGYFVRQNVRVGKRDKGGYEGELDIVAYHPETKHLIHLEPSSDTDSWAKRESRYERKFRTGKTHIKSLFKGLELSEVEQKAVFLFGAKTRKKIGGGEIMMVSELIHEIHNDLKEKSIQKAIVPENFPHLRTIQVYISSMSGKT